MEDARDVHPYESAIKESMMFYVSAAEFQSNPRLALHQAKSQPVVVLNQAQPEAFIMGFHMDNLTSIPGVRSALGAAMYRNGGLSIVRAARVAQMPLVKFIEYLSCIDAGVVQQTALQVNTEISTWHPLTTRRDSKKVNE